MDDYKNILDKESGKDCLILGGSPSIESLKIENFKGVIISMGSVPLKINKNINIDYWVSANSIFPKPDKHYEILNDFKKTMFVFASSVLNSDAPINYKIIKEKLNISWFEFDQRHFQGFNCNEQIDYRFDLKEKLKCCDFKKKTTIQEYVQSKFKMDSHYSTASTVAIHALALAMILGCKKIFLAGIDIPKFERDYNYVNTTNKLKIIKEFMVEILKRDKQTPFRKVISILLRNNTKSFFYPDIPIILNDFEYLNKACKKNNIELYNLSKNSTLRSIKTLRYMDGETFFNYTKFLGNV